MLAVLIALTLSRSLAPPVTAVVAHNSRPPRSRYNLTVLLDPPTAAPPLPHVYGRAERPLVVIDAGHGGHDPGAVSPLTGVREKDATLAIAKAVRDELIRGGRVRVALTREDDRFLILQERSAIARALKAGLFISIHADSAPSEGATGATIYTLSEVASDRAAAELATRENRADVINGVNLGKDDGAVSNILIDLAQRETIAASSQFADILRREAGNSIPFRPAYHLMAGFVVLKAPDLPAVLLETGYLTNPAEEARITSFEGRAALAAALRRAIEIHFARASLGSRSLP